METKKCPYCKTEIDKKSKVCANCKRDVRSYFSKHPLMTIFLILMLFGGFMSAMISTDPSYTTNTNTSQENITKTPEQYLNSNRGVAKMMCKNSIKMQLKSPQTAEFDNEVVQYTGVEGKEGLVTGVVSSQNSFGALLSSSYACYLKYENKDYSIIEAKILE